MNWLKTPRCYIGTVLPTMCIASEHSINIWEKRTQLKTFHLEMINSKPKLHCVLLVKTKFKCLPLKQRDLK